MPQVALPGACEYDARLRTTSGASVAPAPRLPAVAANTWMLSAQLAGSGIWMPGPGAASLRGEVEAVPSKLIVVWTVLACAGLHATKLQLPVLAGRRPSR